MMICSTEKCVSRLGGWFGALLLLLVFALYVQPAPTHAAETGASAGIFPTRVVIPASQRSGAVTLSNSSSVEVSYRMTMIEMGLDTNGRFRQLSVNELPKNHNSSKPLIRFSPRQVRLKPGQSQVVRVIVRRSAIAAVGEYRSHLVLQALPVLSENLSNNLNGNSVLVNAAAGVSVGVSIPVIVRHGKTDAQVTTKSVTLKSGGSDSYESIALQMGRDGNRSAYGDFSVYLVDGKREKKVGMLKSWALYHPYLEEQVRIPLDLRKSDLNTDSKIRVVFSNNSIDSTVPYWVDQTLTPVLQ